MFDAAMRLLAAPAAAVVCFVYLVLGGADPECAMTVANGPSGRDYQIGTVPPPAQIVPCPPMFLGNWQGYVVSTVPEGTRVEVRGYPCFPGT